LAPPGDAAHAQSAVAACFVWLAEVEATLTRFDAGSELCQLNANAGEWRPVSELLFTAVAQALMAARASDGLFDPTLLTRLERLGYDRDYAAIARRESRSDGDDLAFSATRSPDPAHSPMATDTASGGWRGVRLDIARRRIRLPHGCKLDLGGIAKGWAADEALARCFAEYPNVIVDVGGDMRIRGAGDNGQGWPIGISASREAARHPPPDQPVVALRAGGVATSGAQGRWWYHDGQRQRHLIDPRTGQSAHVWISDDRDPAADPRTLIAAATALAPTAAHAEVAAKVALLRGYPQALRAVEAAWAEWVARADAGQTVAPYSDAGVALVLTLGTGEVAPSSNLGAYLETLGGGGEVWLS